MKDWSDPRRPEMEPASAFEQEDPEGHLEEFLLDFSTTRSATIKVLATSLEEATRIGRQAAVDYIDQMGGRIYADELTVDELGIEIEPGVPEPYDWEIEAGDGFDGAEYVRLNEEA